jgi:hypothetical protein
LKAKGGTAFPPFRLTYFCAIRGSTTGEDDPLQRMKPLSGLSTGRCAFCLFASSANDTESVRGLRIAPSEVSLVTTESLHSRWSKTERVAQPDLRSFDGPPTTGAAGTHFPVAAALAAQSVSACAVGRRETEYMRAAKEETATVSSNNAISSSPITKPRRRPCLGLWSPGTSTLPSCRPTYYEA